MRLTCRFIVAEVTILVASLAPAVARSQTEGAPPVPPAESVEELAVGEATSDDGVEVLTRGPLHEAFAAPVEQDPEAGPLVETEPPEPIEELPPEVKPEGENVEWIPGYWAWDDSEERYIWISGVWRALPPNREWVPGYWAQEDGAHRWISGYWAPTGAAAASGSQVARRVFDAAQQAEAYVSPPPESLEAGPTSPAPSEQHFWIPGCWIASDATYRWRPGYWYPYVQNWVWVPDHYVWTPAGCVFVSGYWDYTLQTRGMAFAPVYFTRTVYRQPSYIYRPHYALEVAQLALHLFVHPRARYYWYGDYYGATYASYGYRPWYQFHFGYHDRSFYRRSYDPLLAYYGTHYRRHGVDYVDRLRGWHRYYDRHVDRRPPRKYDKSRIVYGSARGRVIDNRHVLARPIAEVRHGGHNGRRVVEVDRSDRQTSERLERRLEAVRDVARARRRLELDSERARDVRGPRSSRGAIVLDGRERQARERTARGARDDDRSRRERTVVTSPRSDDRRAEYRKALERARTLTQNARQETRARTGSTGRPPARIGGDRPADSPAERRAVVRGQQPERTLAENRARELRQRVLRLDPTDAGQVRNRTTERSESRPGVRPTARPDLRTDRADASRQQALDAARQARQAIIDRQRSRQRSLEGSIDANRRFERSSTSPFREQREQLRGGAATSRARTFTAPSGRSAGERVVPRAQFERSRPQPRIERSTPQTRIERATPQARIERSRAQLQRQLPQALSRQREQARTLTRQRSRASSRTFSSGRESRSRASARPEVRARPETRARSWQSPRSSAGATMQRGSRARIERASPAAGNRGRGRGNRE